MEIRVGRISHYYTHLGVAGVEIESGEINVGDTIHITGHTTDLIQPVESMELEHQHIDKAQAGQSIGIKVRDHVREHDVVMKVIPE